MGVARISFTEDCDVVVGGVPDEADQPILDPRRVGETNKEFMMPDGLHCFSIAAPPPFSPQWQVGQVVAGQVLKLTFTRP
jgi:hypothetical protein